MGHPLEGCRAKLNRATVHLDAIRAEYDDRSARNIAPVEFAGEWEFGEDGPPWFVMRCGAIANPPPIEWGVIVGDAIHNIRSALDHLACRLVELNGGTVTKITCFPIWGHDPRYARRKRRRFRRSVDGMAQNHKDAITDLQPYRDPVAPRSVRLATLYELSNLDKHQVIIPMLTTFKAPTDITTYWSTPTPDQVEYRWNTSVVIEPGTEIVRWRTLSGQAARLTANMRIVACYGSSETSLGDIREMRSEAVAIVELFAADFA